MNAPAAPQPAAPQPAPAGSPLRRLASPLAALTAVALPTAFVGLVDPNSPGHYPVCPVLQATGWWCPGCGGLRSVHALTRGDVLSALHDNVLVVALAVVFLAFWGRWVYTAVRGLPKPGFRMTGRQTVLLVVLLTLFTVLRNLPVGVGLAPPVV
ncbi:DUF2752 domain-containing protein [Kitasatospora sp. NPDC049285]|uniref:DUF2752 domain-containing protein n=1 Tax=Kitasatospora sp. NPDC049285 TaxID=3157096 RepID=UPI00342234BE